MLRPYFSKIDNLTACCKYGFIAGILFLYCLTCKGEVDAIENSRSESRTGKQIYDYYCYQCHGYSGDAETLASAYLQPAPRNFTATNKEELIRQRMLDAVTYGSEGTAMVTFKSVLSQDEIEAVVDYIRTQFMVKDRFEQYYHTAENGWPEHERYAAAFPYVSGDISLETPGSRLNAEQLAGKRLYLGACISCHDQPKTTSENIWEARAVSYPRRHYSHKLDNIDAVSGATRLYSLHEQPVADTGFTEQQKQGRQLFLDNCAFCHAPDGSGKNWIGSFLDRKPRDFTADDFIDRLQPEKLAMVIKKGVIGTSMPAWESVLNEEQIASIVSFLKIAFSDKYVTEAKR